MGASKIRKIVTIVDETHTEMGQALNPWPRRAAAAAVIENPFAGRFEKDLSPLYEVGAELGDLLGRRAVAALGIEPAAAHSYGKAAIVGELGEREHAAAILHPALGKPFRATVERGAAIIPSAKKVGGPGTEIDVPLHFKDDEWLFSHFDAMAVSIPDAPRANEIVVILVVTDSGRPLARVGAGVTRSDVVIEGD